MSKQKSYPEEENIFDIPEGVEADLEQAKLKKQIQMLVVKKKKKKKKVKKQQMTGGDRSKDIYMQISQKKQGLPNQTQQFFNGKTYEQIIAQSKKPSRMPPPLSSLKTQNQNIDEKSSSSEDQNADKGSLVFHIKRADPLYGKNYRQKKPLFINDSLFAVDVDSYKQVQEQNAFTRPTEIKVGHQGKEQKKASPTKKKEDNYQKILMRFLRDKYGQKQHEEQK